MIGGLLGEVGYAARHEGLVQTPDVVRLEDEHMAPLVISSRDR